MGYGMNWLPSPLTYGSGSNHRWASGKIAPLFEVGLTHFVLPLDKGGDCRDMLSTYLEDLRAHPPPPPPPPNPFPSHVAATTISAATTSTTAAAATAVATIAATSAAAGTASRVLAAVTSATTAACGGSPSRPTPTPVPTPPRVSPFLLLEPISQEAAQSTSKSKSKSKSSGVVFLGHPLVVSDFACAKKLAPLQRDPSLQFERLDESAPFYRISKGDPNTPVQQELACFSPPPPLPLPPPSPTKQQSRQKKNGKKKQSEIPSSPTKKKRLMTATTARSTKNETEKRGRQSSDDGLDGERAETKSPHQPSGDRGGAGASSPGGKTRSRGVVSLPGRFLD